MENGKNEEIVRHYINISKYKNALKEVEALLLKSPEKSYYLYLRAECLYHLKRNDEALFEIKNALEEGYSTESCIRLMGMIYWGMDNNMEAKKCFEEALRLNSNDAEVLAVYGVILYCESLDINKFEQFIKDALKIAPNNLIVERSAFFYYHIKKDITRMKDILEKYLENTSDEIDKLEMLGDYELYLKHYKQAKEHYKQAFLFDPTNKAILEKIKTIDSDFYILGIPMSSIKVLNMMISGLCILLSMIYSIAVVPFLVIQKVIFNYKDYSFKELYRMIKGIYTLLLEIVFYIVAILFIVSLIIRFIYKIFII